MKTFDILFEDGAEPQPHEIQTALFLRKAGKKVTFLAPKNQPGIKTPDIAMDGVNWEIKSPVSAGARSIEHAFRSAIKQSENVLFDLRRSKANDQANLAKIKYVYRLVRGKKVRAVLVISKEQALIDISSTI